jgi:AcrR family transcriptional regulator
MHLTERERNGKIAPMVRLQSRLSQEPVRSASAGQIKSVALRLFAERGVDGVTVREIATAAGQKNHGAVGYYFGSKEALVREIILDGAIAIDERRNAALDRFEANGGPHRVREVVDVLIFPAADPEDHYYLRFIVMLTMTHRDLMMDALENRWNSGYQRCLDHLRRLMPKMPPVLQNQRLLFMGAALGAVLAARQQAMADASRLHPVWDSPISLEHFAQSLTALIEAPLELPLELGRLTEIDNASAIDIGPIG